MQTNDVSSAITAALPERVRAIDWLRGIAVLLMIQCHALVLLRPELRVSEAARVLSKLDGLVAPAFLFAAGFSLALLQVRSVLRGKRHDRLARTLRRIGEILAIATFVNWMWFPLLSEPRWILRMDILQCVGLSLLLALPLVRKFAARPAPLRWVSLGMSLGLFAVAPLAEGLRGTLADFLNRSHEAVFPLLPWAGYVFLGASAGATAAAYRRVNLYGWLAGLAALGLVFSLLRPVITPIYPPHQFFVSSPCDAGQRWMCVSLFLMALLEAERRLMRVKSPSVPRRFIEFFGSASLSAYFFHEALLYYRVFGLCFEASWGGRSDWGQYTALTALLIGCTALLCHFLSVLEVRAPVLVSALRQGIPWSPGRPSGPAA